ncbi:N-acyl-phosphatidylethanolamine-hydrolyzing phospholipase D [Balamuthia mandrillaris]
MESPPLPPQAKEALERIEETSEQVLEALSQPTLLNGKFDNPWDTWSPKGFVDAVKWMLNRKAVPLPSPQELDQKLPVLEPNWDTIYTPRSSFTLSSSASASSSSSSSSNTANGKEEEEEDKANGDRPIIQATWIGHSSFLVQMEGVNFLTDPVWSLRCSPLGNVGVGPKRFRPVPFPIARLPPIDFVVISHNHYDHLDYYTVQQLGNSTKWYVPMGLKAWFLKCGVSNVVELGWWEKAVFSKKKTASSSKGKGEKEAGDGEEVRVEIVATPAQHWSLRSGFDRCQSLWCSWAVMGRYNRVFFAGDTGYCPAFAEIGRQHGPFDLGLIPIGAYCPRDFMKPQHVDPVEAVQLHEDIRAKRSIGMHWGTFVLTDEHVLEPPKKLFEELQKRQIHPRDFFVMKHGQTVKLVGREKERRGSNYDGGEEEEDESKEVIEEEGIDEWWVEYLHDDGKKEASFA